MRPRKFALSGLVSIVLGIFILAAIRVAAQAPQNPQPTYRSAVTVVPLDVRVIDTRTGQPVTDLKQADFKVFEDNVRQELRHFAPYSFGLPQTGGTREAAGTVAADKPGQLPTFGVVPQTRRVFLIVLARGRLQGGPEKVLDAAANFVRTKLLPRDLIAVFAYDRATDFTTTHEQAAQVIDRFKAENDAIAMGVSEFQRGLAAVYGSRDLPASVQESIDRVFRGTSALPYSPVGGGMPSRTREQAEKDRRRDIENALDNVIAAARIGPQDEGAVPAGATPSGWEGFDSFAGRNLQTLDDTQNLYGAIAYMQRIEGEKHLVFVTPGGLNLRHLEDYQRISAAAADARVAIDVVRVGFGGVLAMQAMRSLSDDTGGVSSIAEYGEVALDRIDRTTRTGYLLGYYPSNARKSGEYREIRVTVSRPGTTVLVRRGYHATDQNPSFDRRAYLTQFRLQTAAERSADINDIPVKMRAALQAANGQRQLTVDAVIDASHLTFATINGLHAGRFEIAVVAMTEKREIVAGTVRTLSPAFTEERFARIGKDGLSCTVQMLVPASTRYVRFIVYDYERELLGTAGCSVF